MQEKIISAENVDFHYSNEFEENENAPVKQVLKGVSLDIKKGEFTAILGHNGSGKSTIAKHMNAITSIARFLPRVLNTIRFELFCSPAAI